jgi:hypothetical protein
VLFALSRSLDLEFFLLNDNEKTKKNGKPGSHVSDNDPERIAKAQAQAAEGHVPSRVPTAPHWSEVLASDSVRSKREKRERERERRERRRKRGKEREKGRAPSPEEI